MSTHVGDAVMFSLFYSALTTLRSCHHDFINQKLRIPRLRKLPSSGKPKVWSLARHLGSGRWFRLV